LRQGGVKAEGRKATKMWASMRSSSRWKFGRRARSLLEIFESFLNLIIVGGSRVE
jgi:hypothetical protein